MLFTVARRSFSLYRNVTRLKRPSRHHFASTKKTAPRTFGCIDVFTRSFGSQTQRHFTGQSAFAELSYSNKSETRHNTALTAAANVDEGNSEPNDLEDGNDYEEWHELKQQEFQNLSTKTDEVLKAVPSSNNEIDSTLQLISQWKKFNETITPEMYALSTFRSKNPQYPPSDFMSTVTFEAAAKCQSLLVHLLSGHKLSPHDQVEAYKLCMETWAEVYHPSSGDRAEDILEAYGERFGGDMDLAPTLDCYKIVLRGYNRSCSSYFRQDINTLQEEGGRTPGEKAWEVINFLSGVSAWGDVYLKPDVDLYSLAISAMRNSLLDWKGRMNIKAVDRKRCDELAIKAFHIFKNLNNLLEEWKLKDKMILIHEWNHIIRAYTDIVAIVSRVKLQDQKQFEQTADELLNELEDLISNNAESILRDAVVEDNSTLMKDLQRNIEEAYANAISSQMGLDKNHGHFDGLASALKNTSSSEKMLLSMRKRSRVGSSFLFPAPTQDHYGALIRCVCECLYNGYSTSDVAMSELEEFPHDKAVRLLEELEKIHANYPSIQPIDGSIHREIIWAKCQTVFWKSIMQREQFFNVADSIQAMLEEIECKYHQGFVRFSASIDATKMFNSIFRFYSKRSKYKGGDVGSGLASRTLRLLNQIERWYGASGGKIKPDRVTIDLIMKILADTGSYHDAESMLTRMEALGLKPNEKNYNTAMLAQSRAGPRNNRDTSALKAESILQEVKQMYAKDGSTKPTVTLYTNCINALGRSFEHNRIPKILELAKELTDLYGATKDNAFKPDSMFYSAVLDALSKSKDKNAVDYALRFLCDAETKYSNGDIDSGPNRFAYTNVLHAIAKSSPNDGARIAEEIIRRMIERATDTKDNSILPDKVAYTALFQALANSRQKDAVDRAEKWFQEMEDQYRAGDDSAKPNKMTYTALINCWGKSNRPDAPVRAAKIVTKMEEQYASGDFESKPDAFVYGSIIKLLSRSNFDDKAIKVWEIYEQMKGKYESGDIEMKPNNVIMTSIIFACGRTNPNKIARVNSLKVLVACLAEIKNQNYCTPNSITFRTLLDGAKHIVPDDEARRPLSSSIFQMCCRNGQLDKSVLEALENAQPELYAKLPKGVKAGLDGKSDSPRIPSEWTRNASKHR